jgi:hypothetical protein
MSIDNEPLGVIRLLSIAAKAEASAMRDPQTKARRIAARLIRDPNDVWAVIEALIDIMKAGGAIASAIGETPEGFALVQCALAEVSRHLWEEMWDSAHPEQRSHAWEGDDAGLMSLWCENVRALIKDCHQDAMLAITAEEYYERLTAAGLSDEAAEALAGWFSTILPGTTPSS